MATVWVYPAEVLPLKIRAKGAALAAAADFAGNFLVVEVTPVGLANIGFGFYFIWAALNLGNAIIVWLFYPETANLRLESIDLLFTHEELPDGAEEEKQPFYRKMQWSIVGRADAKRNRVRKRQTSSQSSASSLEESELHDQKMTTPQHIERSSLKSL